MNYIEEIITRMNIRNLRGFLLDGSDSGEDLHPYSEVLEKSSAPIYNRIETLYTDNTDRDLAVQEISDALTAYENVYMELGMKAGARMLYQLLSNTE